MAFPVVALLLGANLAYAQGGVSVTFTTDIKWQTLSARSSPAQVTNEDETALKSKGYAKIGTISASKESKKADPEITQQLQSAILQKAAESGGDAVLFTKAGELATETTGRHKNIVVSEGTVWRNDPDLAKMVDLLGVAADNVAKDLEKKYDNDLAAVFGAPAKQSDSTQKSPDAGGTFSSKLGKNIQSEEMKTWLSSLGTPEIDRFSDSYYYNFKPAGISLRFNTQDQLDAIFFYSEGADGFSQYHGDLPYGLSFQNTRREIESILGPPDASGGGAIDIWTSYHSKGVGITYNTKQSDDLNARMHHISISTP
jgi:hypothetical protein